MKEGYLSRLEKKHAKRGEQVWKKAMWSEVAIEIYKKKLGELEFGKEGVEKMWRKLEEKVGEHIQI